MKLWLDAQLSPEMAIWVTQHFGIETIAIRDVGLRSAEDRKIFNAAKQADIVLITKDSDFSELLQRLGAPPRVIWLRCGNTSNERLKLAEGCALDLPACLRMRLGAALIN